MNDISIVEKEKCYGCGACYNICPENAINMRYDDEGFIYPVIDETKCVDCGRCAGVCPALRPVFTNYENPECYAVWASDDIRMVSSSGGMFTLVADHIFDKGGYVCGAAYSDDYMSVGHIIISDRKDLQKLRGSKYVQSDTKTVYRDIKKLLDEDRHVLFSGCPCQVAGLYSFLGKDYEKLVTLDLVCHGANSPKAYRKFLEERAEGRKIEKVNFREKEVYGWSTPTTIHFSDGSVYRKPYDKCLWYKGFLNGVITRPSCGHCVYAQPRRQGDITLADFWQIHRYDPSLDDRKGTSLVLVNNSKGKGLFKVLKSQMKLCKTVPIEHAKAYNGQLKEPQKLHKNRHRFFQLIDSHGYDKAVTYALEDKYDIAIMGFWCSCNYGSMLTYYALHKILESMNLSILMIEKPYIWENDIEYTDTHSRIFGKEFYKISAKRRLNEFYRLNNHCDIFILGSDQAWNYGISRHYGFSLFLDFADDDKKKIAYATSFGVDDFYAPEDYRRKAAFYLQRFDAISVREDYGVKICKEVFDISATHVLDPIFVCNIDIYEKLIMESKANETGDYIATYILDPNNEKRQALIDASIYLKMKLVNMLDGLPLKFESNYNKLNLDNTKRQLSVKDFLYYIKNSKFVITDSFHGTCFAIIFKKPFITIANATRGIPRFVSLFSQFNLMDRMVLNAREIKGKDHLFENIDYNKVYEILQKERERSLKWLKDAITAPKERRPSAYDILSRENAELKNRMNQLEKELNGLKDVLNVKKEKKSRLGKVFWKKGMAGKLFGHIKKYGFKATANKVIFHIKTRVKNRKGG